MQLTGFHHLTAITADALGNHAFYTGVLGLRLVGFSTDEPLDRLGETIALPTFLESRRVAIETGLKPLVIRSG